MIIQPSTIITKSLLPDSWDQNDIGTKNSLFPDLFSLSQHPFSRAAAALPMCLQHPGLAASTAFITQL